MMLRHGLQAVEGSLIQVQGMINNLVDNLELGKDIKDRLQERMAEKVSLEAQQKILISQISEVESISQDTGKQLSDVKELIEKMSQLEGQDRVSLRLSLRGQLRRLITQINVFPDRFKIGIILQQAGERRLITTLAGNRVELMDIPPGAYKVPSLLWLKPWKVI